MKRYPGQHYQCIGGSSRVRSNWIGGCRSKVSFRVGEFGLRQYEAKDNDHDDDAHVIPLTEGDPRKKISR